MKRTIMLLVAAALLSGGCVGVRYEGTPEDPETKPGWRTEWYWPFS